MRTSTQTRLVKSDASGIANVAHLDNRMMLTISDVAGGAFKVAFGSQPDATSGIFVSTSAGFKEYCREWMGSSIDSEFRLIAAAGTQVTFAITETVISR